MNTNGHKKTATHKQTPGSNNKGKENQMRNGNAGLQKAGSKECEHEEEVLQDLIAVCEKPAIHQKARSLSRSRPCESGRQ